LEEEKRELEEARRREEEKMLLDMEESVRIEYLKKKEADEKQEELERELER